MCISGSSKFARTAEALVRPERANLFGSGSAGLGIHPYVHPGRTRCMRHSLPHARRIGRGMLLLLLPLRAFGHGRTGKFVDRAVAAGTLENPIAAGVDHSPPPAGGRHIFPSLPGVPPPPHPRGGGTRGQPPNPRPPPPPPFPALPRKIFPPP